MFAKLNLRSEFSRNVLTLMTGTTIGQAIPLAISPILSRIYSPEDFGVFALYLSVASVIALIATGRYEVAIMLPENDEDSDNLLVLSVIIAFAISLLTLLLVVIINEPLTRFLGNPEISFWLYIVPVTVLLTGLYQSLNYWNNRRKQYMKLSKNRILQSGTTSATNLGLGFSGATGMGLITGNIAGQFVSVFNLGSSVWRERQLRFSKYRISSLARIYKKFPLFNLPNALVDGIRVSGIDILITRFFSSVILGQYYLAMKMLQAPTALIGYSISQVFLQKIATLPKDELSSVINKFLLSALAFVLPVFGIIFFFAEQIFVFVFGQQWAIAGQAASILAPWIMLNFLTSPLSNVFVVLNRQEVMFVFSLFYMAVPLSIIFFVYDKGFVFILGWISFAMSLLLVVFIFLTMFFAKSATKRLTD